MRRAIALFGLGLAALSCDGGGARVYDNNDLQLVTAYAAKEMCTCLFVMEQTDALCTAWTVASPNLKSVRVDRAARRVEAQALLYWGARARYVDDRSGCVIE